MNPASSLSAGSGSPPFCSVTGSNHAAVSYPRYPTAPPVKRGSSGTNGELKSAIMRAQHVDERLGLLRRHAGTFDDGLAIARAQHHERILAEERVPPDVLASLDAFQQKRVVGVLGNPEKSRNRRQQVGHELFDDRHERASLRQLDERFERRSVS